jgi:ASC-1-like (ASCH) protein
LVGDFVSEAAMPAHHLAILRRDVVAALLSGRKRIETRFYRHRCLPLGRIRPGDVVHFKVSGGGVIGSARVTFVREFSALTPAAVDRLRRLYQDQVCAPAQYWTARRRCRYGVLIGIGPVRGPARRFPVPRQYGGGWVVLSETVGSGGDRGVPAFWDEPARERPFRDASRGG